MPAAVLLLFGQCQKDETLLGPVFFQLHDLSAVVAMAGHLFKWFNIFPSQQMWMTAVSGVKCSLITYFHAIWAFHDVSL